MLPAKVNIVDDTFHGELLKEENLGIDQSPEFVCQ